MATEENNPASKGIDALPTGEILNLIHKQDTSVMEAVRKQLPSIEEAVEDAVRTIKGSGEIFYIGAGTSGRLGMLDSAEVLPTFGMDCFKAIMAGGESALYRAVEGAEDNGQAGIEAATGIGDKDMAVGISASGQTRFVLSALETSKANGARCWLITCNEINNYPFLDGMVKLITGAEIITGSTRMKAATAVKLTLNMFSTATMIRLGRVYDGLMIDVMPTNKKLINRAEQIIIEITGCTKEEASEYLHLSGMRPKTAVVMLKKGVSREEAEKMLENAGGSLRKVLD